MLRRLTLQNVALVERAELEFSEGLNVLTGETGAGKSVILDSIDFVLGAKAEKSMVRSGESAASVTAEFYSEDAAVRDVLQELDVEPEETILITRKLTADGRSTLKVNGMPVTSTMLRRLTALLVDIHGQSEHFFLLKESNQLKLLDSIGGAPVAERKKEVGRLLAKRKEILSELSVIGGDAASRARRADILAYQIAEIERVDPKEGEEETLRAKQERYRNLERILEALRGASDYLTADGSGEDALRGAQRQLNAIAKFDAKYEALSDRLESLSSELSDIAEEIDSELDAADDIGGDAEAVEARLDELKGLKKKYGGDYAAILAFLEKAREELTLLTDSGARYEALTAELETTDSALYSACVALTKARKTAAEGFTARVVDELFGLNIPSARFEIQFDEYSRDDVAKTTSEGLGGVRFLFSANAGEPLKELGKIISGGEMSRFMLAVKAQSSLGGIGTYLFDEIDAGIGGKTARAVAEKFEKISRNVQIIAVTHLAQIAAFADRELLIEKRESEGKTFTTIRAVEGEERIAELARLIGGESEHVTGHARALAEEAAAYKISHR